MQPPEEHQPPHQHRQGFQFMAWAVWLIVGAFCLFLAFRLQQIQVIQKAQHQHLQHQYQDLQETLKKIAKPRTDALLLRIYGTIEQAHVALLSRGDVRGARVSLKRAESMLQRPSSSVPHLLKLKQELQHFLEQLPSVDVFSEADALSHLMSLLSKTNTLFPAIHRCIARGLYLSHLETPKTIDFTPSPSSSVLQNLNNKLLALWKSIVHRWGDFTPLIVVKHVNNTADRMWLDQDVFGQLRIALQVALWAVLHHEQTPYQLGVEQAYTTMTAISACDHKAFDPLLAALKILRQWRMPHSIPDLNPLLQQIALWLNHPPRSIPSTEKERMS